MGAEELHEGAAVIHRLQLTAENLSRLRSLSSGAVLITGAAEKADALLEIYRETIAKDARQQVPGGRFSVLTLGPELDSPDHISVGPLLVNGTRLELQVSYTSARLRKLSLLRNVPWRPLVVLPVAGSLKPGKYALALKWQAVDGLPSGHAVGAPAVVSTLEFSVTGE